MAPIKNDSQWFIIPLKCSNFYSLKLYSIISDFNISKTSQFSNQW